MAPKKSAAADMAAYIRGGATEADVRQRLREQGKTPSRIAQILKELRDGGHLPSPIMQAPLAFLVFGCFKREARVTAL